MRHLHGTRETDKNITFNKKTNEKIPTQTSTFGASSMNKLKLFMKGFLNPFDFEMSKANTVLIILAILVVIMATATLAWIFYFIVAVIF